MNKYSNATLSLLLLAAPIGALQAQTPQPGLNFSGNIELDNDARSTDLTDTVYDSGGRVKIQIDGRRDHGDYFVSGKGELLIRVDGTTEGEDAWIMFGRSKSWNFRVGRYENSHLFPEGRDTVIEHATSVASGNAPVPYEMDAARGRADNGVRLRIQSVDNWLLELGGFYGGGDDEEFISAIRPVAIYDNGSYTLRLGYESVDDNVKDQEGFGVSVGFAAGGAHINLNLTQLDDDIAELDSTTFGANLTAGGFAVGLYEVDTDYDAGNDPTVTTVYGSYSHMLYGIDKLYITYAFSTSSSDDVADGSDDQRDDVRVRLNYEF